jgi:UDP-glucose 4-epimerase
MIRRIAITGSSGYYGRKLIDQIRAVAPEVRIFGCDVVAARESAPDEFVTLDVRDPNLPGTLQAFAPDTIVHLAFVVNPTHDDREMRSINVDGSRNVFAAVRTLRPKRFLMASSATVYGSFPDNPVPADETWPIRARPNYRYAVDKTEIERLIVELGRDVPEVAISWTRPAIIYGPQVDNYLSKFLIYLRVIILMDGFDCPLQFVHEDDVAAATWQILQAGGRGPYNIGPPDWVHLSEIAKYSGRPIITLPFWLVRGITTCWWSLRLPMFEFPVGMLYFLRYPWVAAPNRLERELGFHFQHSGHETLCELLRINGKLKSSVIPQSTPRAPGSLTDRVA